MPDIKPHTQPRTTFERYLRANGLRCTQERLAIAECAAAACGMFTADELHDTLEAKGIRVSMATVYNTLHTLTEASLLLTHSFDPTVTRFEYIKPSGYSTRIHLICNTCGHVRETKDAVLMQAVTSKRYSTFLTSHCAVYIYGTCGRCRRKAKKTKNTDNTK